MRGGSLPRHGMSGTVEYHAYIGARSRCRNPNNDSYDKYGARGIEFRFNSFEEFFAELGMRPDVGYSVDRIDNDGHYEPGNIRWATLSEQNLNRRPLSRHCPSCTCGMN